MPCYYWLWFRPLDPFIMDTVHPPRSSQCDHKTYRGQEKGPIIGIYRQGCEAQRGINISRGSLWRTGKGTQLDRLVSRKENMIGQKFQPLELCPVPHTGSSWRSIPAPREKLVHWAKLLLSPRPSLKAIHSRQNIPSQKHKHQQEKC